MVAEVFAQNFQEGLDAFEQLKRKSHFEVAGRIYNDEIILSATLTDAKSITATTCFASSDFDPKASAPRAEEILACCVDALAGFFGQYLDPENPELIEQLASESLSALEDAPFEWSSHTVNKRAIWLKVDRSNPKLEQMADEFIKKAERERKPGTH